MEGSLQLCVQGELFLFLQQVVVLLDLIYLIGHLLLPDSLLHVGGQISLSRHSC